MRAGESSERQSGQQEWRVVGYWGGGIERESGWKGEKGR